MKDFTARMSGILLHPTCLPGTPGIGTMGKPAYAFVDWLNKANQSIWQVLPLGPTGYGDSPYASFSTFAGNPLLIDLEILAQKGRAAPSDIIPPEYIKSEGAVDFGAVVYWKIPLLKKIAAGFLKSASEADRRDRDSFVKKNADWLDMYAIFMSIKDFYDEEARRQGAEGALWNNFWPSELAACTQSALDEWKGKHTEEIEIYKTIQFFFFEQWEALKSYAQKKGISIIGDIPIFVAPDSADVWANQKLFLLDKKGLPTEVAGVPPDYFSATGQLWGNPLYDWKALAESGYEWWLKRIRHTLEMVDYVRIDHFRGFEAYWAVPFGNKTAEKGEWKPGPAHALFEAIRRELGNIPIIAEDLGVITDEVRKLRDDFGLPGMKILQFAFDLNEAGKNGFVNPFLPHMYEPNCVVYTGTHDNETMQGWLDAASDKEIALIGEYLGGPGAVIGRHELCRPLVRAALASCARFAVIPLQDLFAVGSEGRINRPAISDGTNWVWRMSDAMLTDTEQADWLRRVSRLYGRNLNSSQEGDSPETL